MDTKKRYEGAEIIIVTVDNVDVISTSGNIDDDGWTDFSLRGSGRSW